MEIIKNQIQISVSGKATTLYLRTFVNILSFEVHNKMSRCYPILLRREADRALFKLT